MSENKPRTPQERLAEEVARWERGLLNPNDWDDAPDAVPRASETKPISMRVPVRMLEILKGFASREGIGYQVLIKQWLDDRIRQERAELRKRKNRALARGDRSPPVQGLEDHADFTAGHYNWSD